MRRERGFTLVELVAVMLIAAILATFAAGALNPRDFDAAAFADEVRAQVAYAQKVAVASRRPVTVTVAGNAVTLTRCNDINCGASAALQTIRGNAALTPRANSGVLVNSVPGAFTFNALGSAPVGATITVTGTSVQVITITAGTGYVF